ncbi:hypothetical protein COE14_29735, partial [Bacillus thuringiensis]
MTEPKNRSAVSPTTTLKFAVLSNIHLFNRSIIIIFLSYIREYFVLLFHYNKKRKSKTSNFLTNICV